MTNTVFNSCPKRMCCFTAPDATSCERWFFSKMQRQVNRWVPRVERLELYKHFVSHSQAWKGRSHIATWHMLQSVFTIFHLMQPCKDQIIVALLKPWHFRQSYLSRSSVCWNKPQKGPSWSRRFRHAWIVWKSMGWCGINVYSPITLGYTVWTVMAWGLQQETFWS